MSRPRSVTHLADTRGGEIVRLASGCYRVGNLGLSRVSPRGVERWCRLLRDDLAETRDVIFLPPTTPVIELVQDARTRDGVADQDADPVRRAR